MGDWIRGFGHKYRQHDIGPNTYVQTRVVFKRGRMPQRIETHTGCRKCAMCVIGINRDWAERHEAESH